METTKKFEQLPPLAGVHFAGFKDVRIESRQLVVRRLRNFIKYCLKEATSPAVQVILGEWGEGKTEAYQRYIQPEIKEPNSTYLVSASTVARSLSKVQAESPLASLNFLATVFHAIRHEAKADLVPPLERFASVEQWLEATLQAHAKGKILVFIDEFEELILDPPALKAILSGLKELINKQYRPVTEEGQYPGIVSFFLSCTPDAYARMQRDPEIAEVFGSWERRVSKIQLAPVTKREGVKFLYDLMRYAYNDHLPEPLPIKDLGVFYTLQSVGRGNLGALVTLFTKIFNEAAINDQTMHIIDGTNLLDWLAVETISVYGGIARCVEHRLLESLKEGLDEREIGLFKLLVGELRPFSVSELTERLAIPSETEVSALITHINQKMAGRVNVAIVSFAPLREDLTFQDVQMALQAEIREDEIQIDGFTQRLDELEDELTFFELCDGQLIPKIFFPWDHRMIAATFEGITPDSARRLEKRVEKIVDPNRLHYRLSRELIFQLFPTPIPVGLEFIKDRNLRLQMWRDTTARFPQLFRDKIVRAFLNLIQYVDAFGIEADDLQALRDGLTATIKDITQNAVIRCYCCAHYGDLEPESVRRIEEGLREVSDAHLAIVIHVGEVTERGREEIRIREMEERLLLIPLHTSLAKRLLITYQANTEHPQSIDERLFRDSVTRLFKLEIELSRRIKEWLEQGWKAGIVLKDLYKATARSDRELADALKFYINRLGEPDTPENIFRANERLMDFVPFGSRVGFIPDIESAAQLTKYTEDLAKNGFVLWNPDRTVHVTYTSPERRLLRILERFGTVAKANIAKYFINCAQARNILEDVYLNILKHKGVVEESRGFLSLVRREKALEEVQNVRAKYQELLKSCKQQEEWPAFAHIFVTKQRDSRFIAISELEAYLDELYDAILSAQQNQNEVLLQQAALFCVLAGHLQNSLLPKVEGAIQEARRIREDTFRQVDSLLEELEDLIHQYNRWLKQDVTSENVREVIELREGKERLSKICRTPVTVTEIGEEEKRDDTFAYQSWARQDRYFNVALMRLQKSDASLRQQVERCRRTSEGMRDSLRAIEEIGQKARSRLLTIQVSEKCKLSKVIHARLEVFLRGISATNILSAPQLTVATAPALTLVQMLQDLRGLYRPLEEQYRKADEALTALLKLAEAEENFQNACKFYEEARQKIAQKADAGSFRTQAQVIDYNRAKVLYRYESLEFELQKSTTCEAIESKGINQVRESVEQLAQEMEEATRQLRQLWKGYVRECEYFVDSVLELIRLAKRQNALLCTEPVETKSGRLIKAIRDREWPERPISDYESEKAEIRKATLDLLKETLDEAEGNVLIAVIGRREHSQSGWFNLTYLAQTIAEEMAISGTEAEMLIRSLVRKGYLAEGVAIPV